MKKYQLSLLIVFSAIFILCLSFPLHAQMQPKEFVGYLSDAACAKNGVAGDGANLATNPEKHTVACMKMPACMASGYGILMKNKSGKYVFTKFDPKGTDLAKKILESTKKMDNMKIKVMGMKSKNMIQVESITELD